MQSQEIIQQVFQRISQDPENNLCMDCRSPDPLFTSLNHGILICGPCSEIHVSLGPISTVKSISDELWDINQLRLMAAGGNSAFKEYLDYYDIDHETPINIKYQTRACQYYRRMLSVVSENRIFDEEFLPHEIGIMIADEELKEAAPNAEQIIEHPFDEQSHKKSKLSGWLNKAYKSTISAKKSISNKITEISQNPTVRKIEQKTIGVLNKLSDKCVEISQTPRVKAATDKLMTGAKKSYNKLNSNKNVRSIKKETMNFLAQVENGAYSAYDRLTNKPSNDTTEIREIQPTAHLEILKD